MGHSENASSYSARRFRAGPTQRNFASLADFGKCFGPAGGIHHESYLPLSFTETTLATIQTSGNTAPLNDLENIYVKYLETHSAYLLRNAFGNASGPDDFLMSRDSYNDNTLL